MKRLAASVILAARNLQIDDRQAATFAAATVRAYRERMAELGVMGPLDVWYDRIDVAAVLAHRQAAAGARTCSASCLRGQDPAAHQLACAPEADQGGRRHAEDHR